MSIDERLEELRAMVLMLVERQTTKEWYTTEEFAPRRTCRIYGKGVVPAGTHSGRKAPLRSWRISILGHLARRMVTVSERRAGADCGESVSAFINPISADTRR